MTQHSSLLHESRGSSNPTRHRPRTSLRVRNVAEGVVYHLVFEGDLQRLSGRQLRHHLSQICHIPAGEQHLMVHGADFAMQTLGAAVGLRQDDTVELTRSEREGSGGHRGPPAATSSSLRPSTDAGTMSPEAPNRTAYDAAERERAPYSARESERMQRRSRQPATSSSSTRRPEGVAAGGSSMGSTATSNTRIAPSPERLVERAGQQQQQQQQQYQQYQQYQRQRYVDATHDDSQLPLSTSATTLSSIPLGRRDGEGEESPRPHMPFKRAAASAAADGRSAQPLDTSSAASYPRQPPRQASVEHSPDGNATTHHHRPSYEVPSPYERPPQRRQQPPEESMWHAAGGASNLSSNYPTQQQQQQQQYGTRSGLNRSRMDPVPESSGSGSRAQNSSQLPPPPPLQQRQQQQQHLYDEGGDQHHALIPAASARPVPIRADDLETVLAEQDYIWRMEEYRFRTERLNRLNALQNRQRELAFEAARYDQAVAVVSNQLSRERRKLTELQDAMTLHSASLNGWDGQGNQRVTSRHRANAVEEDSDDASEVIEVDV